MEGAFMFPTSLIGLGCRPDRCYKPYQSLPNITSSSRTLPALALVTILSLCVALAFPCIANAAPQCESSHSPNLASLLSFKNSSNGNIPHGWGGSPQNTISLDNKVVHEGKPTVRIGRNAKSALQFSNLGSCIQVDFTGKLIELRGFIRTNNVKGGFAGLWIREDGQNGVLALDNMQSRYLHGTTGWSEYTIGLPHNPQARRLVFGILLDGTGTAWFSGLQLLVDGKPISQSPYHRFVKTILDTDHQFDHGSGITIKKLTQPQIENLVTLGKVWGFLKYYDPAVTSGHWQWDYELFRIMPVVLAAPDRNTANAAILNWIKKLGPVSQCNSCSHTDTTNLALSPDLGWIDSRQQLGDTLSQELRAIRANPHNGKQFYVALLPYAENPVFNHELTYPEVKFPDSGFQLLALFRFWNVIQYWYPYRQGMGENWDRVLAEFIPKLALAKDFNSYQLQMMALIAMIRDSHANLWSSLTARPPAGRCHLPVRMRFVQGQAVVTGYMDGVQTNSSPFKIGDIVTEIDGKSVSELVKDWSPYYGASNEAAQLHEIATFMTDGPCGGTTVHVRRGDRALSVTARRIPVGDGDWGLGSVGLPGPAFRLLTANIAYLNLNKAKMEEVSSYIERAEGTKGLIIDVRNYPLYIGQALASHFIDQPTPYVRFTVADLDDPGAFQWKQPWILAPQTPHYSGKIVILVDATTLSRAEFVSMTLRAVPGAIVIGSTTEGADGDVSSLSLPGGLQTGISGIGVFYPDKRPTQRVGIVPNVVVTPTIADIRAGRDPVLEKAVRLILGSNVPE